MMDAKRLKEIRKALVNLYHAVDVDKETKQYIFNNLKIEWLIERVEELEELIEDYKTVNKELHDRRKKLRKQNKCYREALEEIARGRFPGASYKARQALEGESE